MKILKVAICFLSEDDTIVARKVLESKWSVDAEIFTNKKFNISIEDEIAEVITENIKLSLTPRVIREMLKQANEGPTPVAKNSIMETINENKCKVE
jgi:predicted RNA methylase